MVDARTTSEVIQTGCKQAVVAAMRDGVLYMDTDMVIREVNPAMCRILGCTDARSLVGNQVRRVLELMLEDTVIEVADWLVALPVSQSDGGVQGKIRGSGMSDWREVLMMVISLGVEDREGWTILFEDVSKEQQLEAMKLDFVSMAAHELRTPLTSIQGYLSFLRKPESIKKLSFDQTEYVSQAYLATLHLNQLIENLLVVSRIEKGTVSLDMQAIEIDQVIRRLVAELEIVAIDKQLALVYEEPTQPLPLVKADAIRMTEVIGNLISNALKYTEQGEVRVAVKVIDGQLVVSMADTGPGMTPEALKRLFTKFFRVKGDLEAGPKGTGLGLYISKNIIEAHGGKIWVESQVGKGTTFYFSLPVAVEEM